MKRCMYVHVCEDGELHDVCMWLCVKILCTHKVMYRLVNMMESKLFHHSYSSIYVRYYTSCAAVDIEQFQGDFHLQRFLVESCYPVLGCLEDTLALL